MAATLKSKVVAISGAASGMGLALAQHLYPHGVKLSLTDNRQSELETAVELLRATATDGEPTEIFYCVTDVRKSEQVDAWIEQTVETFGGLDGAVNLAGIVGPSAGSQDVAGLSNEEWDFVSSINLTGVFYANRAQVKAMRAAATQEPANAKTSRSIVNAASTAGLQGNPYNAVYSASKHAVIGLTRSIAKETGRDNIRVNAVAPGLIDTPMLRNLTGDMNRAMDKMVAEGQALGRRGAATEVASMIACLLSSQSSFMTGSVVTIDGGEVC